MEPVDPFDSFFSPDFTYSYSKYSCIRAVYFPHVVFAYLILLTGIGCFFTRLVPVLRPAHVWFGRGYIISMLWCMGTSLVIHNTGLPAGVLLSFIWVLLGLSLGWIVINIHQVLLQRQAMKEVQSAIKTDGLHEDLSTVLARAKGQIIGRRTFMQRVFSLKTLHAMFFFTSWINIVGRIFASNQSGDFTCHTYPYYKMIDTKQFQGTNATLTSVPIHDPAYDRLPWARTGLVGWGVLLSIVPMLAAAIFAVVWAAVVEIRRKRITVPS